MSVDQHEVALHLVPATIDYDGEGPISSFFRPHHTGSQLAGVPVQEAAFRGRKLSGLTLQLPEGYHGVLLQSQPQEVDQKNKQWHTVGNFKQLTAWKHDLAPSPMDPIRRGIEWLSFAKQINSPISAQELEAELKQAA